MNRHSLVDVLLRTPLPQLDDLCNTDKHLHKVCDSNSFWNEKAMLDFGKTIYDGKKEYMGIYVQHHDIVYPGAEKYWGYPKSDTVGALKNFVEREPLNKGTRVT